MINTRLIEPRDISSIMRMTGSSRDDVNGFLSDDLNLGLVACYERHRLGCVFSNVIPHDNSMHISLLVKPSPGQDEEMAVFRSLINTLKTIASLKHCSRIYCNVVRGSNDHLLFWQCDFLAVTEEVLSPKYISLFYESSPYHHGACVIERILTGDTKVYSETQL